jgi:hypothetical protein
MQLLTAVGSKLCVLHQASVGSAGCEPAGRLDCPSNAATAKMALLENRTGASVNPGNRQDNAQIVVFVADQAHDGSQPCGGYWKSEFSTRP